MSVAREFTKGLWRDIPVFRICLGLCPALAVTTTAFNGLGMGMATTFVLVCSNIVVSLLRKIIPNKVRIPMFIVVIATFVTIIDFVLKAVQFELHQALGIFIPLIVVNCIILGRAEAFASKNSLVLSIADGLGMGIGFTLALFVLGAVREVLGSGELTIFIYGAINIHYDLLGPDYVPAVIMILPPGAFLALGLMLGFMNKINALIDARKD